MGAIAELRQVGELRGQLFGVRIIAFSPDGEQIATGDVAGELLLWRNGQVVFRWDVADHARRWRQGDRIHAASFSPDGLCLYVASGECLWCLDTSDGSALWEHRSRGLLACMRDSCMTVRALSNDSLVATYDDGRIEIRRRQGDIADWWWHPACPLYAEVVDEGRFLVGADDRTAGVWDMGLHLQIGRCVPGGRIMGLAASRVRSLVAVRTLEELVVWDRTDWREAFRVPVGDGLPCLDICPTRDWIAAADLDGVGVWDARGTMLARADAQGVRVLSVKFAPGGSTLFAGCMDGTAKAWTVRSLVHSGHA